MIAKQKHAAAMALFRLMGAGARFEPSRRGFQILAVAELPSKLIDAAMPHTGAIGALLKLRTDEEHGTSRARRWVSWRR